MIHGHGNEIHQSSHKIKADFSSNVWDNGASEEIFAALSKNIRDIKNYPEPDSYSLRNKIATYFDLMADNIIVTNGSTEAFYLIAQVFAGKKSVIICPSFAEYADACEMHHHQVDYVNNSSGWHNIRFENRVVWFANPNNPDGKTIAVSDIILLLKNNSSSVFILDEVNVELCYGVETSIPLLSEYSNLIIVRSFTKAFSIPGLRLGYMLSSEKIIAKIKSCIMPWNVNSLAMTAGIYIMEHYERLLPDKEIIRTESAGLQKEIGKSKKMKVYPSACNFFMVQSLSLPAYDLKEFLLREYGLLIRDASNFKELDPSFFRISVQKPEMNKLLIKGIKYWVRL